MVSEKSLVKREDGEGKIIDNIENRTSIKNILKENYKYILQYMKKEKIELPDIEFNIFKEIVHINIVVGFSIYLTGHNNDPDSLILKFIYVIPEYRGNNLLVKDIYDTIALDKFVSIELPNRFIVESLVNGGLAKIFDERFVFSCIPFTTPLTNINNNEKEFLKNEYGLDETNIISRESPLYDLKLCAIICPAYDGSTRAYNPNDSKTLISEDGYLSEPTDIDIKFFDSINERKNDKLIYTPKYFELVFDVTDKYNDEIEELFS